MIHLSGESDDEMEKICREIDVFIEARVWGVKARLQLEQSEEALLLQELRRVDNRSYLWVHLTLDLLQNEQYVNNDAIIRAIAHLPRSVDEAYDRILSKSHHLEDAKRLLHIVVAAFQPLTLKEMGFALILRGHHSYKTIDLPPDKRLRETIRDMCGLFVTIIDSRIYLLHQTAKEFLVHHNLEKYPSSADRILKWKHSLLPKESHRIVAEICIQHLLFEDFEADPLESANMLSDYVDKHGFLEYSATYWAAHAREADAETQVALAESILEICQTNSNRFMTWFRIYWRTTGMNLPRDFTTLMVLSYFGL